MAAPRTHVQSPPIPEVSGILVRALADAAMRLEVPPSQLLAGEPAGLWGTLPLDVRMPLPKFSELLQRAEALTGEPAIGLLCGFEASECAFDLLAPLVSHVPTLRHAIAEVNQFTSLVLEGVRTHLSESAGVARIRCDFPRAHGAADRGTAEFVLGGTVRMLRLFGATRSDLHAAFFEHRRPARSRAYERIFWGCERFGQPFTGLEFAAHLLDRKHLHENLELQTVAHAQAEQHLLRLSRPASLVDRLQRYLANRPLPGVPTMDEAARALDVSVRSLRRRLTESGLSFRKLTQEQQARRACTMLRNPGARIQAVADALGFADTGAFHRAFRRWSGVSASEYASTCHAASAAPTLDDA